MEFKRAQTLEALSTFIQSQRALLAHTQSDIERLKQLRDEAAADSQSFVDNIDDKLNQGVFCLSDQLNVSADVKQSIDCLRTLAADLRLVQHESAHPSLAQRSPLSPLQQLVKDARRTILDPVLTSIVFSSDSSDDDERLTPEERRKERERAKIRELRMRRIGEGGLTLPKLGKQRESGVFIRRDMEDESAEVDISMHDLRDSTNPRHKLPGIVRMEADGPAITPSPAPTNLSPLLKSTKPSRARRAATKVQATPPITFNSSGQKATKPERLPEPELEPEQENHNTRKSRGTGKQKSETFKQAWSVSEQHLLERLLEEIPDGEKNRWAKISKAMNGRRTARQVASRVQKYFEKLKRFGLDIGGADAAGSAGGSSRASSLPMAKERDGRSIS
ncbi:hypothetical protein EW146_g2909 [Bondarzewia mesenterica]|uniref:Uncharacterized protein n=1 Tax=Bondarzewia mesenterica TaxID=1095465 RepID=A0A4S4LZE2_9AGAM|nr:hypothetical protein EW146_g2909 [Bondarzewia mesenterica]